MKPYEKPEIKSQPKFAEKTRELLVKTLRNMDKNDPKFFQVARAINEIDINRKKLGE